MTVWARSGRATIRASRTSRRVGGSGPRGVLAGAEQLLDEERVAVRAPMDLFGEVRRRRRARGSRRAARRVWAGVEPLEVEPLDPPAPLELGEPRQQRVAAVQLVGAEGHDQHDAIRPELADQERDRLAGGRDRPSGGPR